MRQIFERMLRPVVRAVILSVGERSAVMLDDPHRNALVIEHLFRILVFGCTPPFYDMGPKSPPPQQSDVSFGHRTKMVS